MPKTVWVIGYQIFNRHLYLFSTVTRDHDGRNMITPTDDIAKAKLFNSKQEASDFLSTCITNGKPYTPQEYRVPEEHNSITPKRFFYEHAH